MKHSRSKSSATLKPKSIISGASSPRAGQEGPCGWLKDKFGLSWQVVPAVLPDLIRDQGSEKGERVMKAMLRMRKLDIAALQQAAA